MSELLDEMKRAMVSVSLPPNRGRTILCNPASYEKLKEEIGARVQNKPGPFPTVFGNSSPLLGIKIIATDTVPATQPSGKFIVDGEEVEREDVRVEERFIEYGPEDIEYLLRSGRIKHHEVLYYYLVDFPNVGISPELFNTLRYNVPSPGIKYSSL